MQEIRFHGRGGQGTVVASILLAKAFFNAGYWVQSFPVFGVERRGAPVEAYLRLDKEKILIRSNVYTPDHVLATCPTGWGIGSEMSVKIARLAVQTNAFPLYEVEDGINYTLNFRGDRKVKEYLTHQGRFNHLTDSDIDQIQKMVDGEWDLLLRKAGMKSP